jgi:ABC-type transporter Mla subunit MlaD
VFKRIIGVLLVIVAVVSLVLSVVSTVAVWNFRKPMAETATAGLRLLDETLGATTDAFASVEGALQAANGSIASAQDTFKSLGATVTSSGPTLGSLSRFLSEGLPQTLESTQGAMKAAAQSAQLIDGVLESLSRVPFIDVTYDPENPLSDSLAGIGDSLATLPDSLGGLGGNLATTSETLPALGASLDELGNSMDQIQASLDSTVQVVAAYKGLVGRYQAAIRSVEAFIPTIVSVGPIIFTFFAFWLAVVQVGALLKGWQWLRGDKDGEKPTTAAPAGDSPAAPLPEPAS